ncbi:hypothetical protein D6D22_05159 [Aureobasidium pullulans]|uniref:Major facilitator superfamily transporter n=1 Tax=Aureobasidium pullulans TaxID=5580 RepID=A0A4S8U250_AURPU|nr:hypothetical protein D6D26_09370 [Aureobasidium pullulans]THW41934.1 hypothetical protein D6D22_05159 [Aureobasidium pullulans]THW63210.1 hypothetical protein D6D20_03781 [Aureobasidium pullulans]TIA04475.1 hypothetical protein D6C82_00941 [Aureobasidium pullulans]
MPFRIPKRKDKGAGYTALDGRWVDGDKERLSDDDDASESGNATPMLRRASGAREATSYPLPRRRFTRYFTLIIVLILLGLGLTLARLSALSEASLRSGLSKPPPPPPTWETFPFLKRYHGGIRTLVSRAENKPEFPDPENNTLESTVQKDQEKQTAPSEDKGFQKRHVPQGQTFNPVKQDGIIECFLNEEKKSNVPQLLAYSGVPKGFPDPVMGSYDIFGLNGDVCFDRFGRLGPYGLGYSKRWGGSGAGMDGEREGADQVWGGKTEIDYREVNWAQAQQKCAQKNKNRFKPLPKARNHFFTDMPVGGPEDKPKREEKQEKKLLARQAVVIRTWQDFQYDDEDMFYLRALVNELSLQSGGEYTVHFLVHVKDNDLPIWSDDFTYQRVLNDSLPLEFRGMGTLWSERQMSLIYGGIAETNYRGLPIHGAYRSTNMPLSYFAHMHPEYDFFWHWEMDIRYTGHFYHLFDKVGKWSDQQPRKGLWERNGRFYIPSEHGSWDDFKHMVRVQTEHGTAHKSGMYEKISGNDNTQVRSQPPIWGPQPPTGEGDRTETENDPQPPTTPDKDNYSWGVGEQADFITFNPLFDPHATNWILAEDVTGYNTSAGFPPRRTAIITASRLSHRLLETMHRETALMRHSMFSEMWPGSCALHHGLKAVYAPHPVYIDRRWPTSYLAAVFNNGLHGASGGARTSVFSDERQHNFLGTSWYYHAGFPGNLWKRWLGYKVDGDGGEMEEVEGEGRMCLPGMLLHPVKHVDLIYEHREGE